MRAEIIHIHHSCFMLALPRKLMLFDYPDPSHLPQPAAELAARRIRGADLTVFVSHCHADHFDPDILTATRGAARRSFVVSEDVPDMFPGSVPDDALVVEPDEQYEFEGMQIATLESNDLGVAYLIEAGPTVYYGGDLADWAWDNLSQAALAATREFFLEALSRLEGVDIDIAFVNLDARLANLAGGLEFAKSARPKYFVPMHTFGSLDYLERHRAAIEAMGVTPFIYHRAGETMAVEV